MKMLNMFFAVALLAVSSVAFANNYDDVAPPSGLANFQEDVVVGEEMPAPSAAPEVYEGAPVEGYSYGYQGGPSWSGGCCGDNYSAHSHLWDNYCAEKHCGWGFGLGCCRKSFGGCGGFSKGCCEPKCGKCRKICLPKLHLPKLCCHTKSFKGCGGFSKGCCQPKCGKCCRKLHLPKVCLPKLRLFSRKGCCKTDCCYGGDEVGEVIYEGQPEVNEVPAPASMEMPNEEVPAPPMPDQGRLSTTD